VSLLNTKKIHPWLRIATAIPLVVIAAMLRTEFLQLLGTTSPFITFYPAVTVAALLGGLPAGLLATALSIFAADYFLIEPIERFGVTRPLDVLAVSVFTVSCILIAGVSEAMHRARARAFAAEAREALAAEREQHALKISESENRYHALFENMLEGFAYCRMIFDDRGAPVDFVYLDVNSAFVRLTGVEDVTGKKLTEVFPGIIQVHPELLEIYGRVALTGVPEILEISFDPLGAWLSISVYSPEREYFVAVFDDITVRKRANEEIQRLNRELAARAAELEAVNKDLEAFNYSVAHDLRRPLNLVNGYCELIRELYGDKLDDQCRGYLKEAQDGAWQMNRLIDSLLDFSRLARVEPCRETVDLSAIANVVAAELQLAEPERRVTFTIADVPSANGDARLLRVVLDNLIGNAWKYTAMREGALIEFGAEEVDGSTAWFVRDNGSGFDMADAGKLFTPFQRLKGAEKFSGFGIGLATVERIIDRHGGRVWAEGELNRGATFYFTLTGAA
jgi:signal transduction histidine kinase